MALLTLFGGTIQQPLNNAGAPEPVGTLTFYATGTLNLKTVYHDAHGSTPWTNPVTLDAYGRATVFLNNDAAYDIVFKTRLGVTVWTLTAVVAAKPAVPA